MRRAAALFFLIVVAAPPLHAGPRERAALRAEFADSWKFYKWRIEQGDELIDLEDILTRIREKYARLRRNAPMVERELTAVRALRDAAAKAAAVGGE